MENRKGTRLTISNVPQIGLNVVKYGTAVYSCVTCSRPVVVTEIYKNGQPQYYCPHCKHKRNRQQMFYLEYDTQIEFRKVGKWNSERRNEILMLWSKTKTRHSKRNLADGSTPKRDRNTWFYFQDGRILHRIGNRMIWRSAQPKKCALRENCA